MDWRIPGAVLVLAGVLVAGSAVTAVVEEDLSSALDEGFVIDEDFLPPDSALRDLAEHEGSFEIPSDLPLTLPEGTRFDVDLNELTIPEGLDLKLPDDLSLDDFQLQIPDTMEGVTLAIPPGAFFDGNSLKLPDGGSITLPDGSTIDLDPGARVDLPPDALERLKDAGIKPGRILRDMQIPLSAGSTLGLDGVTVPKGTDLKLPAGSRLRLPPGTSFPGANGGTLPDDLSTILPPGTNLIPPPGSKGWGQLLGAGAAGFRALADPDGGLRFDPEDADPPQDPSTPEPADPDEGPHIATAPVLEKPSGVEKGKPFRLQGSVVRTDTGIRLPDAPIQLYAAAWEEGSARPGPEAKLLGSGRTDARGEYAVQVRFPDDAPAGEYGFWVRVVPHANGAGERFGESWMDPPTSVTAGSILRLDLPDSAPRGSSTRVGGFLTDSGGVAVAGRTVAVAIEGASTVFGVTTAADGSFGLDYIFQTTGEYRVAAVFEGDDHHARSETTGTLTVVTHGFTDLPSRIVVIRGDTLTITGRVVDDSATGVRDARVTLAGATATPSVAFTDRRGSFTFEFETVDAAAGEHNLKLTLDSGVTGRVVAEVRVAATLHLSPGDTWIIPGGQVPFIAQATDSRTGAALDGEDVAFTVMRDGEHDRAVLATVDKSGDARAIFSREDAGRYTITATMPGPFVDAEPVTSLVRVGTPVLVLDESPVRAVRGAPPTPLRFAGTLAILGEPLAEEPILVTLGSGTEATSTTAFDGRFRVTLPADTDAPGEHMGSLTAGTWSTDAPYLIFLDPVISLITPPDVRNDAPMPVTVTVLDDTGQGIPDVPVTVRLDHPGGVLAATGTTNRTGVAVLSLATGDAAAGPSTITAIADAGRFRREARTDSGFTIQAAVVDTPSPWPMVAGAGVLVAAAGTGAFAWSRRSRGPASGAAMSAGHGAPPVPPPLPGQARVALAVALPAIDGDLPRVWSRDTPLRVRVSLHPEGGRDVRALAGRTIRVAAAGSGAGPGASVEAVIDSTGAAEALLSPAANADTITATLQPDREWAGAHAALDVRFVDYAEEIARDFDAFLDAARRVAPTLARDTTPREAERLVDPHLPPAGIAALEAFIGIVEYTNYSPHAVARAHYVTSVRAAREVADAVAARAGREGAVVDGR